MTQQFSGPGMIGDDGLFSDFVGVGVPVAGTDAGPINFFPFIITGDGLAGTDSGAPAQAALNGVIRLTTTAATARTAAVGTGVNFQASMSPLVVEARVALPALTARRVFVGFNGANAGDQASPLTGSTTTLTLTSSNLAGLFYDSGLTSGAWHYVRNGGSTAGATTSTSVQSTVSPTAAQFQILRVVAFRDGRVEYWIDGELVANVAGAISTTADLAAFVMVGATTTTVATADVDYLKVKAGRHWDVDGA